MSSEAYEPLYAKGLAIGFSDIRTDMIEFHFRDERFNFHTNVAYPLARHNGYFYTAPIEKLRELKKES